MIRQVWRWFQSLIRRSNYQTEFADLKVYISDIGTKNFNGVSLLDGGYLNIAKDSDGNILALDKDDLNGEELNFILNGSVTVTNAGVQTIVDGELTTYVEDAIIAVADCQALVGTNIQRIQFTQEQVNILNENLAATVSRSKDVDVAEESTQFARNKILVQSGTAMLA